MKKQRKSIIQEHHIRYDPEVKVAVFKGEHFVLTLIQRRKRFSKGFLQALDCERARMNDNSVDLSQAHGEEEKKRIHQEVRSAV